MAVSRLIRQAENYGLSPENPLADGHTFAKKIQSATIECFYKTYPTILGTSEAAENGQDAIPALCAEDPNGPTFKVYFRLHTQMS